MAYRTHKTMANFKSVAYVHNRCGSKYSWFFTIGYSYNNTYDTLLCPPCVTPNPIKPLFTQYSIKSQRSRSVHLQSVGRPETPATAACHHVSSNSSFNGEIKKGMLLNFTKYIYSAHGCCPIGKEQEMRPNQRTLKEIPKPHIFKIKREDNTGNWQLFCLKNQFLVIFKICRLPTLCETLYSAQLP